MGRPDVDQPLEYRVPRDVAGIEAELNQQLVEGHTLRQTIELAIQYRRQILVRAIHSPSGAICPGDRRNSSAATPYSGVFKVDSPDAREPSSKTRANAAVYGGNLVCAQSPTFMGFL